MCLRHWPLGRHVDTLELCSHGEELVTTLNVVLLMTHQQCFVMAAEAARRGLIKEMREHMQIYTSSLRNLISLTAELGHVCWSIQIRWRHSKLQKRHSDVCFNVNRLFPRVGVLVIYVYMKTIYVYKKTMYCQMLNSVVQI